MVDGKGLGILCSPAYDNMLVSLELRPEEREEVNTVLGEESVMEYLPQVVVQENVQMDSVIGESQVVGEDKCGSSVLQSILKGVIQKQITLEEYTPTRIEESKRRWYGVKGSGICQPPRWTKITGQEVWKGYGKPIPRELIEYGKKVFLGNVIMRFCDIWKGC